MRRRDLSWFQLSASDTKSVSVTARQRESAQPRTPRVEGGKRIQGARSCLAPPSPPHCISYCFAAPDIAVCLRFRHFFFPHPRRCHRCSSYAKSPKQHLHCSLGRRTLPTATAIRADCCALGTKLLSGFYHWPSLFVAKKTKILTVANNIDLIRRCPAINSASIRLQIRSTADCPVTVGPLRFGH